MISDLDETIFIVHLYDGEDNWLESQGFKSMYQCARCAFEWLDLDRSHYAKMYSVTTVDGKDTIERIPI